MNSKYDASMPGYVDYGRKLEKKWILGVGREMIVGSILDIWTMKCP